MRKDREQIRELRRQGLSYAEIQEQTGASLSTIHYIVRGILLNPIQQQRLVDQQRIGGEHGRATMTPEQKHLNGVKGGRALWAADPEGALRNIRKAVIASALSYLPHERVIKDRLECFYMDTFHKEFIQGHYFDFVSTKRIIEHTKDGRGKGVRSAMTRFAAVQDDPREKHLYVDATYLGASRRAELVKLGVKVHDLRAWE